ncbi:MAG TPA: NIPSNAP family protein [Candidatus Limnocylindrales bacterium]|nr:NIPSNAP family protein [Candidatus Limnocylindrales bacterium]
MITELRRYRIRPDKLESWVEFFREAGRRNEAGGAHVEFAGVDRETSTYIWLRTYADEADRKARKDAFYGSDWWNEHESFAMDHVIEYDVTFLETTMHRDGGELITLPWPVAQERPDGAADSPPDGWTASTRRLFVRD